MSNLSNLSLNLLVEQVYLEGRVHMMYESIIKEDSNVDNESKSIVKQVVSDMKLNADFMMTYGLGISAFVGPVMELLHNKNINVTKYDATLLIMTASYILLSKSKDDLSKLSDELKKRGIFNELKDVMKIINGSIGLFKTIGKKVGVTVTTLLDVLSFTFMSVPVLNVLKDIAAEKGFSVDNMNELVTGLALSAGSYGLKNLLGKKTMKESVDEFDWVDDVPELTPCEQFIYDKLLQCKLVKFESPTWTYYVDNNDNILFMDNIDSGVSRPFLFTDHSKITIPFIIKGCDITNKDGLDRICQKMVMMTHKRKIYGVDPYLKLDDLEIY